ncbi:hypothetical protein AWE51_22775 [Aquimarina aggregata]|uniref:GH16 domain-containing protein n=1 Tax=Aquimarina aggregata TaxID=1642818 RepID=A0A163BBU0_9FLAO|nr:tectonin domain-containing protein [Aquimarina aggregata]KZS41232.1 hypothetical protein AWE51_22775 [Aquimarina aggregata]
MKTKYLFTLLVYLTFLGVTAQSPIQQNPGAWEAVPEITDEFNNPLNTNKWKFGHPFWKGRTPCLFGQGRNAYTRDGELWMETSVQNRNGQGDYLRCGAIYSASKAMKQGMYIEAQYKASGLRIGSGFWLVNNDLDANRRADEIDIQEAFGGIASRNQHNTNVHNPQPNFTNDQPQPQSFTLPNGKTVSTDFVTYGLHWVGRSRIHFYLDGNLVRDLVTNSTLEPMHALLNTETYSWMTPFPSIQQVEGAIDNRYQKVARFKYIRTWKPKSGGGNPPGGSGWVEIGGGASNVSVDNAGKAWVVAAGGQMYARNGNSWSFIRGNVQDAGAGLGVSITETNSQISSKNNNSINNNFSRLGGTALKVDVDNQGRTWVVNAGNQIYRRDGGNWTRIPGNAVDIGCSGTSGSIYRVDSNGRIFFYNNNSWSQTSGGGATRVDVDKQGRAWVVTNNNTLYRYNPSNNTWTNMRQNVNDVGCGTDGSVWITDVNTKIYRMANAAKSVKITSDTGAFSLSAVHERYGNIDLNIKSQNGGDLKVDVYSVLGSGQKVYSKSFNTPSTNLTVRLIEGTLASGMYIAKVVLNGETKTIKFVL